MGCEVYLEYPRRVPVVDLSGEESSVTLVGLVDADGSPVAAVMREDPMPGSLESTDKG